MYRLPRAEAVPTPVGTERILHQQFFDRGLGFSLHNFVRGLLFSYGVGCII